MPLKVYADPGHCNEASQTYLNDVLRALQKDPSGLSPGQAAIRASFQEVPTPEDADIHLLPLNWNYYVDQDRIPLALQVFQSARALTKPIVAFSGGDYTARIPATGVTVIERCAYRSRRSSSGNQVFAAPSFIPDYVDLYCNGTLVERQKGPRPVIGFCGQAGGTALDYLWRTLRNRYQWARFKLGLRRWEPPPFETTRFRKRVLDALRASEGVETSFIVRRRYRAGYTPKRKDPFHPTRLEFVRNILDTDYTVCIRGGGNFSVRLYETLCLGRIPIFVDTDCVLPYDHIINYREFCVWVDQSEIPRIGEKVAEFHASLSPSQFRELQYACRRLWIEYLSEAGFYRHFHELLPQIGTRRKEPSG